MQSAVTAAAVKPVRENDALAALWRSARLAISIANLGLRHAYVSALVTAGLDSVHAAMAAGHSDPAFTLRTYAHPAEPGCDLLTATALQHD